MSEKKPRPYKHPQINLRIPEELKEKIQELANKNGRSMNSEIIFILSQFVEDREKISTFSKDTYTKLFSNLHDMEDDLIKDDIERYITATSELAHSLSTPIKRTLIKQRMSQYKEELEEELEAQDKK